MHYKILDNLPSVPTQLIDLTLNYTSQDIFDPYVQNPTIPYMDRTIVRNDIEEQNKRFHKQSLHPQLFDWIKTNISDKFNGCSLAQTTVVRGSMVAPHIDRTRKYTLMYLIQTGGEHHRTVFYEAIDSSINLSRGLQLEYDQVKEIDSIVVPLYKWTLLNAFVPHSVENIPETRIAIQLGFEENLW
jgi:hypothetical protein